MANLVNIGTIPNDGTGDALRSAFEKINADNPDNIIVVKQASDFGVIDSAKQYFLAGVIDMGTTQIDLSGGKDISIRGADFNTSGLTSSANNYTLFSGADAGNINLFDICITTSGANSKVFGVTGNTGFEAIEAVRVNYSGCSSLGEINTYRQYLEDGTGRFGGSPSLTFSGNWVGGARITTSIVRSLDSGMTEPLFKAGTGLLFNSRFLTDINCDLPSTPAFIDLAPANFSMSNFLQIQGAIITRGGVIDSSDTTLYPNITEADIESNWKQNIGVPNTRKGGIFTITTEAVTTITAINTWTDIAGTWTLTKNQHTDQPTNGRLRSLDEIPVDYDLLAEFTIDGVAGEVIEVRPVIFRAATSTDEPLEVFQAEVNSAIGSADLAFIVAFDSITMNFNDELRFQVQNTSSANNVTFLQNRTKAKISER